MPDLLRGAYVIQKEEQDGVKHDYLVKIYIGELQDAFDVVSKLMAMPDMWQRFIASLGGWLGAEDATHNNRVNGVMMMMDKLYDVIELEGVLPPGDFEGLDDPENGWIPLLHEGGKTRLFAFRRNEKFDETEFAKLKAHNAIKGVGTLEVFCEVTKINYRY